MRDSKYSELIFHIVREKTESLRSYRYSLATLFGNLFLMYYLPAVFHLLDDKTCKYAVRYTSLNEKLSFWSPCHAGLPLESNMFEPSQHSDDS